MNFVMRLWHDEAGVTYTIEVLLVGTIASLGLIVGLAALRDSVTNELADTARSVDNLNQSFTFNSIVGHSASVAGSNFQDNGDFCNTAAGDPVGQTTACVRIGGPAITAPLNEGEGTPPLNN